MIFIASLVLAVIVSPASAIITNNTANTAYYSEGVTLISGSYAHDAGFMPEDYVKVLIFLGIICWILSIAAPVCQDLFCILTPGFFGASTWYAGYMTKETLSVITTTSGTSIIHTEIITPEPVLQLLLLAATIFSLLSGIFIVFVQPSRERPAQPDTSKI